MALLGHLIARSIRIRNRVIPSRKNSWQYQEKTLKRLIEKAQYTKFGKTYNFSELLFSENLYQEFKTNVPIHDYESMWENWWSQAHKGVENVTWPGKVNFFALSSGTSGSASKHIPVTQDMIKSTKNVGAKQLFSMTNFNVSPNAFEKGILMLGGTTSLMDLGDFYEGDMSGISAINMPKWMSALFYRPGQQISKKETWQQRIDLIVKKAPYWDVATVCGVPAWVQIVFEEIIKQHNLNSIHDIWPNLDVYIHGGVAFEPYKENFKKLLGRPINYIETYMASEGSFGFQAEPDGDIRLVLNSGVFYEFVPFDENNFHDGEMVDNPEVYALNEIVEDQPYALLISTVSGAWRYLIGDVLKFTNVDKAEFIITGRTKQFLSICGEHISVDNLNQAIESLQKETGANIREYTVMGVPYDGLFAHQWFVGCDEDNISEEDMKRIIDRTLCEINDDYAVERTSALKEIIVTKVPTDYFIDYLKYSGKFGAMNKIPRVLKGDTKKQWEAFMKGKAEEIL